MRKQFSGWAAKLGRPVATHADLDLDLCALWELTDGRKGVVQALGNAFGSLHQPPFIHLDGDDRTGASASGENLTVNLDHKHQFRRILVFVTIYEGARSFADLHATVTLRPQHGAPIDFSSTSAPSPPRCARSRSSPTTAATWSSSARPATSSRSAASARSAPSTTPTAGA